MADRQAVELPPATPESAPSTRSPAEIASEQHDRLWDARDEHRRDDPWPLQHLADDSDGYFQTTPAADFDVGIGPPPIAPKPPADPAYALSDSSASSSLLPRGIVVTTDQAEQAMRERAYFLWEQDGKPEGRSEYFWHRARAEVLRSLAYQMWERQLAPTRAIADEPPPEFLAAA